ncbi:MAG TPA: UDP-N-acetylglucosamine--N-acetylmuramyl-(pentapeptide) pyrophosphoryl-undecaprenol N-acetylglucosamine transferase [Candidatus Limnocylindrales bacterium]|nr:UDP-N-acetylglucosamine--N-acetylmuramyl-(pentapeptide) pyrophosphoryl-undecaprenol N-acetylglucosamine transferase [Candidatus Limnocylindrales bacterium]
MRLLIAGGGTGGHIYPALAVAESLRRRPKPPELAWIGGHRGLEDRIVRAAGIPLRRLILRSLRTVDRDVHLVADPARLALSVPQAVAILARDRPAAIFTTGGYVAIPILLAATILRIPVLLWEGNVIPGRSVRATAPLATAIAVSFEATCAALGGRRPCLHTGTPIRETRDVDRLAARERFGVPPGGRVLLVFGGSQAVRRFNAAVGEALQTLVERYHLIHVTGDDGYAAALAGRERLPEAIRSRYRPEPFLRDDMLAALAAADLVVGRAGSSTLAEVTAMGLPMIVVPYPYAGGHQRANALRLAEAGAARLVEDEAFDAATLLEAAAILDDPSTHARMAAAASDLARPAAADAVAEVLLALAERRPLPDAPTVARIARGGSA